MLYFEFMRIRLRAILIHPKAFLLGFIAQALSHTVNIFLLWIIISKFNNLNNWEPFEVLLIYAVNLFTYGLAGFFMFNPCTQLSQMVRNGEFDDVLTKPLNPLFYLVSREFNVGYISHCFLSLVVLILSIVKLNIHFTVFSFFALIVFVISSAMIQAAAFLFVYIPSFWIIKNNAIPDIFFFRAKEFVRYPISIYNKFVQVILTVVLPYAFISFYPLQYFLQKTDFLMFGSAVQYLSPLVGVVLFFLAYQLWKFAINHYQSSGS